MDKDQRMDDLQGSLQFPQNLLRFLYRVFFKPFSLYRLLERVYPSLASTMGLFLPSRARSLEARALARLVLFFSLLVPCLVGLLAGLALAAFQQTVNWPQLVLFLVLGCALGLAFSPVFCIAFQLPFSLAAVLVSSTGITPLIGICFSFWLGLAYSLVCKPATWGLLAGLTYGLALGFLVGPLTGLAIAVAFLAGYFRLPLYLMEAPLSWLLARQADKGDAARLWRWQPVTWDERIWFPLPGLECHLRALQDQDPSAAASFFPGIQVFSKVDKQRNPQEK
jgi:hypothetical protein